MILDIKAYKRVFLRDTVWYFTMHDFLFEPQMIMDAFSEEKNLNKVIGVIKRIKEKEYRNARKRADLPIVEFYNHNFLAIDIDELLGNEIKINRIITLLKTHKSCFAIKGTPSKNLVALFKVDCAVEDFEKVYYKLYLELTLLLQLKIDYLPEPNRLRYISNGKVHYYNDAAEPLTEFLEGVPIPRVTRVAVEQVDGVKKAKPQMKRVRKLHLEGSFGEITLT